MYLDQMYKPTKNFGLPNNSQVSKTATETKAQTEENL